MTEQDHNILELKYIREICRNDQEYKILRAALMEALVLYQWKYQEATDRDKRNIGNELNSALDIVTTHLQALGQYTICEDLISVFEDTESIYNKKNIMMAVGKHMKQCSIDKMKSIKITTMFYGEVSLRVPIGIKENRYNNIFSVSMKDAFVEWCEEYPLDEAPSHFDNDFEPPIY